MINLAVFVSGSGTNLENIIRNFQDSAIARVSLVVSNREDAYALVRAEKYGVPSVVVSKQKFSDEEYILSLLQQYHTDWIILAGFLLKVPEYLIRQYPRHIINLHPALLPKYGGKGMYGHHVHEAVKAAGEKETGITIHYVNEKYDDGEIISQFSVALSEADTVEDIEQKIHVLEQTYFPDVIKKAIQVS